MNLTDQPIEATQSEPLLTGEAAALFLDPKTRDLVSSLLQGSAHVAGQSERTDRPVAARIYGVVVGELLALSDDGSTPLVCYPGQTGTSARRARTTVDLYGPHIGCGVVLTFEGGDPLMPIVVGVLREAKRCPLSEQPGQVEVDADGERLVIGARHELVLRCGRSSLTLRRDGHVEIRGDTILTQASGVNRIRGGSVQLN